MDLSCPNLGERKSINPSITSAESASCLPNLTTWHIGKGRIFTKLFITFKVSIRFLLRFFKYNIVCDMISPNYNHVPIIKYKNYSITNQFTFDCLSEYPVSPQKLVISFIIWAIKLGQNFLLCKSFCHGNQALWRVNRGFQISLITQDNFNRDIDI